MRRGARSPRATFAVSGRFCGCSLAFVAAGSDPVDTPLCRLPVSSKPFCPTTATARAMRVHLSWGFFPLQRSTKPGVRLSRWPPRPPGTVRPQGFSPSRRFLRPTSCWAHQRYPSRDSTGLPAALLGFPVLRPLGIQTFRSDQGDPKNSFLSTAFSSPATSPCWRALPSCASLPHFTTVLLRGRPCCLQPALQGIDRRKVGSHAVANRVRLPS